METALNPRLEEVNNWIEFAGGSGTQANMIRKDLVKRLVSQLMTEPTILCHHEEDNDALKEIISRAAKLCEQRDTAMVLAVLKEAL
jgi:hypothetical protein